MTLDLREGFRRAVVTPFVAGYGRGETPNPCIRCNGSFRFAALLAFARRIGAARLATGHYARVREHRGRLLLARAADAAKDQSYSRPPRSARARRVWFPLGERTKEETRARARAAGLAAAGRPESQEAASSPGRLPTLPRPPWSRPRRGPDRRRERPRSRAPRRLLALHPGPAPRTGRRHRRAAVRPEHGADDEHGRRRSARLARALAGRRPFGPAARPGQARRGQLRYRSPSSPASVSPTARGFRLALDEPAYGVATGQAAVLYEEDVVVGAGLISAVA